MTDADEKQPIPVVKDDEIEAADAAREAKARHKRVASIIRDAEEMRSALVADGWDGVALPAVAQLLLVAELRKIERRADKIDDSLRSIATCADYATDHWPGPEVR